jgi:hypothetical protein
MRVGMKLRTGLPSMFGAVFQQSTRGRYLPGFSTGAPAEFVANPAVDARPDEAHAAVAHQECARAYE